MGTLTRLRDSAPIPLISSALVGRAASAWLRLDGPFASNDHAQLWFRDQAWMLKDAGSKNGTFVDGCPLQPGRAVVLACGARIAFGELEPSYQVADVEPPRPIAQDVVTNEIIVGDADGVALPEASRPVALLHRGSGGWLFESSSGEVEEVEDLETVRVAARLFRLFLPGVSSPTPELDTSFSLRNARFRFRLGKKDADVAVEVLFQGREIARLESCEYGALLLALARAQLADRSCSPDQRGWRSVAELCEILGMNAPALDVATYRARKSMAATRLLGAAGLIEVKRGWRRLGPDTIELIGSNGPSR